MVGEYLSSELYVSISDGVGRFVPVVVVVGRGKATGAWYWKSLPPRTLVFERQKYASSHISFKECLMVIRCGNYRLK
jgi:hypothetical protein